MSIWRFRWTLLSFMRFFLSLFWNSQSSMPQNVLLNQFHFLISTINIIICLDCILHAQRKTWTYHWPISTPKEKSNERSVLYDLIFFGRKWRSVERITSKGQLNEETDESKIKLNNLCISCVVGPFIRSFVSFICAQCWHTAVVYIW